MEMEHEYTCKNYQKILVHGEFPIFSCLQEIIHNKSINIVCKLTMLEEQLVSMRLQFMQIR